MARILTQQHLDNAIAGGKKAAAKIKARNPNYYKEIGSKGGKAKVPKGFAMSRELASRAGTLGGRVRKGTTLNKLTGEYESQDIKLTKVEQWSHTAVAP